MKLMFSQSTNTLMPVETLGLKSENLIFQLNISYVERLAAFLTGEQSDTPRMIS